MKLVMGNRELEMGGKYLGTLHDATDIKGDFIALRERLMEDGYLRIRGLHDRKKVKAARHAILQNLDANGQLDRARPLDEAWIAPDKRGAFKGGDKAVTHAPEFLGVVEAPELMDFFGGVLGALALTYDYKWVRAVGTGEFTGAHYDVVYMGRGTQNLLTCWTPLGDIPFELGGLAVLRGSHRFDRVKQTYGRMDVDRDHVEGWFSKDPVELVDKFGGRWETAEFEMGDAMIFGMFTMHGSLTNTTQRYRLSCDTRFQRADEPADERWVGDKPRAHYARGSAPVVPMEEARRQWGV